MFLKKLWANMDTVNLRVKLVSKLKPQQTNEIFVLVSESRLLTVYAQLKFQGFLIILPREFFGLMIIFLRIFFLFRSGAANTARRRLCARWIMAFIALENSGATIKSALSKYNESRGTLQLKKILTQYVRDKHEIAKVF